mmetsp:Transcript_14501/g.37594  ORF Transcript_14501/g.37594 Transcript_14501/m.37594 type:complete len:201 (-) Transcript_14501:241-843(-)
MDAGARRSLRRERVRRRRVRRPCAHARVAAGAGDSVGCRHHRGRRALERPGDAALGARARLPTLAGDMRGRRAQRQPYDAPLGVRGRGLRDGRDHVCARRKGGFARVPPLRARARGLRVERHDVRWRGLLGADEHPEVRACQWLSDRCIRLRRRRRGQPTRHAHLPAGGCGRTVGLAGGRARKAARVQCRARVRTRERLP